MTGMSDVGALRDDDGHGRDPVPVVPGILGRNPGESRLGLPQAILRAA